MSGLLRLQPLTRGKVAALGEVGRTWHAALGDVLAEVVQRWDVEPGRALPGGSASYVCAARTRDGEDRVVKIALPDADADVEARVLAAAGGRGYAVLHDQAPEHRALLLERLGPSLETGDQPVEQVLDRLADALVEAWQVPVEAGRAAPDRAGELLRVLLASDAALGGAGDPAVLAAARRCTERLQAGDDPARHVVVHGDPHPGNALRVLVPRAGGGPGWVFVDPDGLRADPALDVGITLRDWTGRLEGAGARERLDAWTRRAAERTGTDAIRVADWAFLERVSTGTYLLTLGADRLGRRFLDSAAALL